MIIVENSPSLDGHKLALNLCKLANISITLIPDSNIYAIMSRVNKVIITPQAVLADGGAIVSNGLSLVAIAAKVRVELLLINIFLNNHPLLNLMIGVCSSCYLFIWYISINTIICT